MCEIIAPLTVGTFLLCQNQYTVTLHFTIKVQISHQLGHADNSFRITLSLKHKARGPCE